MLNLSNLPPARSSKKSKRRRGRGNASGKGNYSGRGSKGQRARSGGKSTLALKGIRHYLLRIPKQKGFKSGKLRPAVVNLSDLNRVAKEGQEITPKYLLEHGLVSTLKGGVKILGSGGLNKKLRVRAQAFSEKAKDAIIKAGGSVEVMVSRSAVKREEEKHKREEKKTPVK